MFSLFYGLWKYAISKTEFHVLILGIDKAGKTTVLEKLKSHYSNLEGLPPDRIVPTVGLNIGRVELSNIKLVFWDLGGQPGLRSIWEKYYEEAQAVIYVVDASSPSRFEDSKSALEKVLQHEDLQGAPLLILANKQGGLSITDMYRTSTLLGALRHGFGTPCSLSFLKFPHGDFHRHVSATPHDLAEAVSVEELSRYLDLKKLDERLHIFQAVLAINGLGIKESLNWLVAAMERSKRSEMVRVRAGSSAV